MRIRRFKQSDAPKISRCIRRALLEISSKHYSKKVISNLAEYYSAKNNKIKAKTQDIFVAVEGKKIVGTIRVDEEWILGLFVHPKHMGRGIGSRLLKTAEAAARKSGFKKVRAHVAMNAVGFYKKHGYRLVKKVHFRDYGSTYRVIKRLDSSGSNDRQAP